MIAEWAKHKKNDIAVIHKRTVIRPEKWGIGKLHDLTKCVIDVPVPRAALP